MANQITSGKFLSKGDLKQWGKDTCIILLGAIPYVISILMIEQIKTLPAGGIGIATILHYIFGLTIGQMNLIVNIPLMILGTKVLGKRMLVYSGITILSTSLFVDFANLYFSFDGSRHPFLWTIVAAVFMGISTAVIMSTGATFAGTSVIAKLVIKYFPKIKLGTVLMFLDCSVITVGAYVLKDITALFYSAIYTIVCVNLVNILMYTLPKWISKIKERSQ